MNSLYYFSYSTEFISFFPILGKQLIFLCINNYCVGARLSTLMSISDGLRPYFFRPKMEKTQPMRQKMVGRVFISCQIRHFLSLQLI